MIQYHLLPKEKHWENKFSSQDIRKMQGHFKDSSEIEVLFNTVAKIKKFVTLYKPSWT